MKPVRCTLTAITCAAVIALAAQSAATASVDPSSQHLFAPDGPVASKFLANPKPVAEGVIVVASSTKPRKPRRQAAPRRIQTQNRAVQTSQRKKLQVQRRQGQQSDAVFDNFVGFYEVTDTNGGID